jgi:DNA primase
MARYRPESLQQLRERIDLAEVLSQHIDLKKTGAAYKALCPFHDEKSPSFVVQKGDSHYHCFGCGAHGDAIQFLLQHLKMSFSDAVNHLADRYQVQLETVTAEHDEKKVSRSRLKDVLEYACRFYQCFLLHTDEGKEALQYLYNRGITLQFITAFRLGLAPQHDGLLRKALKEEGFHEDVLEESGIITTRSGRAKEFFLDRITFPIQDATGAVIGFSARNFKEKAFGGKYINTTETELFKKSKVLFGLHHSRKRIAKEKQAIVVEGQLDALRLIHAGFDFTVAGLGTAFGEQHVRELLHLGISKVFLLLDGDVAGRQASIKIGNLFQKEGVDVLVATLDPKMDPDLLLLNEGPIGILKKLLSAQDYLAFLFEEESKGKRLDSPAEKNMLLQEIVAKIRGWNNPIMVHESLKKLANLAKVPEELLGVGGITPPSPHFKKSVRLGVETVDPDRILEGDLLRWLIVCGENNKYLFDICAANLSAESFRVKIAEKIYFQIMQNGKDGRKAFDLLSLAAEVDEEELGSFLSEILSRKVNREKAQELLTETIQRMKDRNWMLEREAIKLKIHSGTANDLEVTELVKRFDELKSATPKMVVPKQV